MKVLHNIFLGILIACMIAMAIVMISRTQAQLRSSRAVIAQADAFLAAHEGR